MIARSGSEEGMPPVKRRPPTRTHRQMVAAWKKDPEFNAAYDELDPEFALLRQLLAARKKAGLTRAGVAAMEDAILQLT